MAIYGQFFQDSACLAFPGAPFAAETVHSSSVPGKTADPGFIAHWTFPQKLAKASIWLATYVSLSRPRSFNNLLSHGLPDRDVIEGGPPEDNPFSPSAEVGQSYLTVGVGAIVE